MGRTFVWCGNDAGIDLLNTQIVADGRPVDLLDSFGALLDWSSQRGLLSEEVTAACATVSRQKASHTFEWSLRVRSALRGVLDPSALDAGAVQALDIAVGEVPVRLAVTGPAAHEVGQLLGPSAADQLRVELASAASRSLQLGRLRVRRCANPDCVLLFYDTSRNGLRRWCDMAGCGNRAKVSAFYQRTRTGPS
ncbi:MAG: CGNR zinc finger domain-containing protein [Acidimicrobiia bacterium]